VSSGRVRLARNLEELERLRPLWETVEWEREDADLDYLVERVRVRPAAVGPFGALVVADGAVVAGAAGWVESKPLPARIGYARIHAPTLSVLQMANGGIVATSPVAASELALAAWGVLERGEAELLALPAMPVESPLFDAFARLGGPLERQRFVPTWMRRSLVLPATFDEFLATRSYETRRVIKKNANRLHRAFAATLRVELLRLPSQHEQLVRDLDRIGRLTYQRAVGTGFSNTPEERTLTALALERGWLRAWVLYDGDRPISYWLGSVYRGTLLLRATGYDDAYAAHRVGAYLLARLIEDACADPDISVVDFGPGRSEYKQHFTNESHAERNLLVFAPTLRARRVSAVRTAVLAAAWIGRGSADALRVTNRVKRGWRRRLRRTVAS